MLAVTVRMDNLEAEMRTLTGQLEEVQYGVSQLKTRLDKMQSDDEARFQALEHPGMAGANGAENSAPPSGGLTSPDASNSPPDGGGASAQPPDQSAGGAPDVNSGAPDGNADSDPAAVAAAGTLPDGTPEQQYSFAFGLLRQANYAAAQQAFGEFLKRHPSDALAGNAQYWLGETFFARNQFQQSAATFARGYAKYPKSPKAPDNLLKLGISLGNLGRKANACVAFAKLDHEYSNVLPAVKDRERQEKAKLGC
jgi:tol-pal system protein YbgF